MAGTLLGCEADGTKPAATTRPPKVNITIGRDTTYITGPLNADGTVNYVAYLNAKLSNGVTPQNNAAAILARAIGPGLWHRDIRARAFKAMGMAVPPAEGNYFVQLGHYVEGLPKKDQPTLTKTAEQKAADKRREELGAKLRADKISEAEFKEFDTLLPPRDVTDVASDQLDETMRGPWPAKQYPIIAGWLKANAKPLAVMTGATKRGRFYLPMISMSDPPRIVDARGASLTTCIEAGRALTARAMLRLKTGDRAGVWADLMAARCLARLMAQGLTLIERLLGWHMESSACQGSRAFITAAKLSPALLKTYLAELDAMPPPRDMRETIALDRFGMLDNVMMLSRSKDENIGQCTGVKISPAEVDWNEVLRFYNHWWDRALMPTLSLRDPAKRRHAAKQARTELEKMIERVKAATSAPGSTDPARAATPTEKRKRSTKAMAEWLVSVGVHPMNWMVDRQDYVLTKSEVLHVATGLALHEAEAGRFPAKLTDLAPKYLKAIPTDRFSGKALVYRCEGKGCVAYSVGMNLKDDGGVDNRKNEYVPKDSEKDDIVVRFKR